MEAGFKRLAPLCHVSLSRVPGAMTRYAVDTVRGKLPPGLFCEYKRPPAKAPKETRRGYIGRMYIVFRGTTDPKLKAMYPLVFEKVENGGTKVVTGVVPNTAYPDVFTGDLMNMGLCEVALFVFSEDREKLDMFLYEQPKEHAATIFDLYVSGRLCTKVERVEFEKKLLPPVAKGANEKRKAF